MPERLGVFLAVGVIRIGKERATFLYGLERKRWKIVAIQLEFVERNILTCGGRLTFDNFLRLHKVPTERDKRIHVQRRTLDENTFMRRVSASPSVHPVT